MTLSAVWEIYYERIFPQSRPFLQVFQTRHSFLFIYFSFSRRSDSSLVNINQDFALLYYFSSLIDLLHRTSSYYLFIDLFFCFVFLFLLYPVIWIECRFQIACVRCGERKRRKENADCPLNFPAFKGQRARLTAQITYRVRWLRQSQSYDCGYRFSPSTLSTHMQLWKYKADESNLNKGHKECGIFSKTTKNCVIWKKLFTVKVDSGKIFGFKDENAI